MSNSKLLEGKVIVVTGAGRGIGRATSLMLAESGAKVVVNDIGGSSDGSGNDVTPAQEVVDEIKAAGGDAVANFDSVTEWEGGQKIIQSALDTFGTFVTLTSTSGLIGYLGQANYAASKLGIVGLSKSMALDMQRFGVTSNCIAPFAWSRLIGSIPTDSEEQKARVAKIQQMTPDKIATLAVSLCSDQAKNVTGQIFGVRNNEIFLFSQPRPFRSAHTSEGWTPETVLDRVLPAFEADFYPLSRSADVFSWDPF